MTHARRSQPRPWTQTSGSPSPWTSWGMSRPFRSAWGMAARGSLGKLASGGPQCFGVACFEQAVERQHAEAEVVDGPLTDHRVAGDARLTAAHGHLAGGLSLECLLVEPALAGDDE